MDDSDDSGARKYLAPHRGGAVLTLGILGLCVCLICGIIAWVMGSGDLRAMREGRMDRSGESMTSAGRICGIISVILHGIGIIIWIIFVAFLATHPEQFKQFEHR
jgi:hypothetical protein